MHNLTKNQHNHYLLITADLHRCREYVLLNRCRINLIAVSDGFSAHFRDKFSRYQTDRNSINKRCTQYVDFSLFILLEVKLITKSCWFCWFSSSRKSLQSYNHLHKFKKFDWLMKICHVQLLQIACSSLSAVFHPLVHHDKSRPGTLELAVLFVSTFIINMHKFLISSHHTLGTSRDRTRTVKADTQNLFSLFECK